MTAAPVTWVLVHPAEVGLLQRLRPAVRATRRGTLVQLRHAPPAAGAQLGLAVGGGLAWYGPGLTADDVAALVAAVGADDAAAADDALAHRRVLLPAGGVSPAPGASPRT